MRMISICIAFAAVPALAQDALTVSPTTTEAVVDAFLLKGALLAALAPGGTHADCPLTVTEGGGIPAAVSFVAGPPAGWSLTLGPSDTPLFAATGEAGSLAAGATGILETLCPKAGNAATKGPWTAEGGSSHGKSIVITGTVQSLLAPFTLEGVFPGGQAVFDYTPVSIGGGAVEYSLSGSGVTGSGEGLYSVQALPNDVYVIEQTTDGCVDGVPGSCRQNSETITLTPVGQ